MKRSIIILVTLLLGCTPIFGQEKEINELIKKYSAEEGVQTIEFSGKMLDVINARQGAQKAREEGQRAREQAQQARENAREENQRARENARNEAQLAREEAQMAREDAQQAREMARHEAQLAREEAQRAREEAGRTRDVSRNYTLNSSSLPFNGSNVNSLKVITSKDNPGLLKDVKRLTNGFSKLLSRNNPGEQVVIYKSPGSANTSSTGILIHVQKSNATTLFYIDGDFDVENILKALQLE